MSLLWLLTLLPWLAGCSGTAAPDQTESEPVAASSHSLPEEAATAASLAPRPAAAKPALSAFPQAATPSPPPGPADPEQGIRPGLAGLPGYQASVNKANPRRFDYTSPAQGQQLYRAYCAPCHGMDLSGRGNQSRPLRDLRKSESYQYGTSDQAVFRSVMYGIPRTAMGNYQSVLKEEQVWDLVNYLRSRRAAKGS